MDHATVTFRASPSDTGRDDPHDSDRERAAAGQPAQHRAEPLDAEFLEALLAALTDMAVRSPRRQADLAVALRRSGIEATPPLMRRALESLEQDGCIEHLVPLADGGLLMQVTAHGIERLSQTSRRHILDYAAR